jgi:hypothetical protein
MKVTINEFAIIQIEEVYNPIVLKTNDGEEMVITMRDSGFEFTYEGKKYHAKNGSLIPDIENIPKENGILALKNKFAKCDTSCIDNKDLKDRGNEN